MSHFIVMVIGNDWQEQLAPFHEFECTGHDDEYVQDIDVVEECWEMYQKETVVRLKDPQGILHDPTDDKFYRDPTPEEEKKIGPIAGIGCGNGLVWVSQDWGDGKGYRTKVRSTPEGWEEVRVLESSESTFSEFVQSWHGLGVVKEKTVNQFGESALTHPDYKYGYVIEDDNGNVVKAIKRTNPNAKWDWYQIGGRWSGYFKVKPMRLMPDPSVFDKFGFSKTEFEKLCWLYENKPTRFNEVISKYDGKRNQIKDAIRQATSEVYPESAKMGTPSFMGSSNDTKGPGRADQLYKKDIDIAGMTAEAELRAAEDYDELEKAIEGIDFSDYKTFEECREMMPDDIGGAREMYNNQEIVQAVRKADFGFFASPENFYINDGGREKYIENALCRVFVPFAFIKDKTWYERGRMGWWGVVTDSKLQYDWSAKFLELWETLDDDELITAIDCHI